MSSVRKALEIELFFYSIYTRLAWLTFFHSVVTNHNLFSRAARVCERRWLTSGHPRFFCGRSTRKRDTALTLLCDTRYPRAFYGRTWGKLVRSCHLLRSPSRIDLMPPRKFSGVDLFANVLGDEFGCPNL